MHSTAFLLSAHTDIHPLSGLTDIKESVRLDGHEGMRMLANKTRDWANIVRTRRLRLSWTQKDLADQVGVSRQWISNFENGAGTSAAQLGTVLDLVAALEIDIDLGFEEG